MYGKNGIPWVRPPTHDRKHRENNIGRTELWSIGTNLTFGIRPRLANTIHLSYGFFIVGRSGSGEFCSNLCGQFTESGIEPVTRT